MRLQENLLNKFCILLVICAIGSCTKSKIEPLCKPFSTPSGWSFGWQRIYEPPSLVQPDFNPDNPDEFLFVYYDNGFDKLYSFNMRMNVLRLIYEGNIIYRPKWGKDGWILLNLSDANIWKIKDNGDSLTQLTYTADCFHPSWNYNYSIIGYTSPRTGSYLGYLIDKCGNELGEVEYSFDENTSWSSPNYITGFEYSGKLIVYNFINFKTLYLSDFSTENRGLGYSTTILKDNNTVIWSYQKGIFETKIDKKTTRSIYPSCNAIRFYNASYSRDRKKILWEKQVYRPVPDSSLLYIKSSIVMMNPDGTGEEEIEIPL